MKTQKSANQAKQNVKNIRKLKKLVIFFNTLCWVLKKNSHILWVIKNSKQINLD